MRTAMTGLTLCASAVFLSSCAVVHSASPTCAASPDDVRAIESEISNFADALARSDLDGLMEVYSDDLVYLPHRVATDRGKEQTRKAFQKMLSENAVRLDVDTQEIKVCGALAYDLGAVRLHIRPKASGQERIVERRFLEVWGKEDGRWRVRRVMNNVAN